MAVHQENVQNFVIFDCHPGEMVGNMEKWQASNHLPVLLAGNNATLHKLEREVFVQMTPFKFSFKKTWKTTFKNEKIPGNLLGKSCQFGKVGALFLSYLKI